MNEVSRTGCGSKRIALFVLWSAVLAFFAASAHAQSSFNYADFSSTSGLALNGSAAPAVNTNKVTVLRLTPATGGVGSAWYTNPAGGELPTPLSLVNGFTTTFAFQITVPQPDGLGPADGFAFVVQGDPTGASALGAGGGSIGFAGITKSVAVEFDTWCNGPGNGDTCNGGPNPFSSSDELSVNSCGANPNTTNHTAGCTFGTVDLSALAHPIYLADGQQHVAQVSYTPPTSTDGTCSPGSALGSIACGSMVVILDGQTVLTVPFGLAYLGLDQSADAYAGFTGATGGGLEIHDIVNWSFMGNVSSAVTQPINTNSPPDLPANFNTAANNVVSTDTDYSTSNGITPNPNVPNPVFLSINNALSQTNTWSQYVVGTPWATSLCTIKAGNGGTDLCSLYVNACYNQGASPTTADDFYCPTVSNPTDSSFITLKDTFDWGTGGKQPITPGTTVSLLKFSPSVAGEKWQASAPPATSNPVCTQIAPVGNTVTQCDLSDTAVDVYGDQTTTRGTSPKTKGWLVSVYGVPMPLTHLNLASPGGNVTCPAALNNAPTNDPGYAANIWSNGACVLDVKVMPATPPGMNCSYGSASDPCNNFQAAPILSWLYGTGTPVPAVQPGPIPAGDTQLKNQNPDCGSQSPCLPPSWDAVNTPLATFFGSGDGQFVLHWSAKDAAGITEKNVQLVNSSSLPGGVCPIPGGSEVGSQCYLTSYFTTMVNIDSTNPNVSSFAFSPAGGTYTLNQSNVTAVFTCADPLVNNVASGVASCTAVTDSSNVPFNSGGTISTSTVGPHSVTVTAVDHAGNQYSQVYNYTVVAPAADVAVLEQETTDYVKHGTNLTYINWALDLTKANAGQNVTVTLQMPSNVLGGAITARMAIVSCSLTGCSSMPTSGGSSCSVSGGTVTCGIGTLPSVYNLKGAVMKLTIPVAAGVPAGTVFKINSTVTSANDPNPKNNAVSDTITVTN